MGKGCRVCLCWGEKTPAGNKATIFFLILKGAKAQRLCSQPLNLSPNEGRTTQAEVTQGESGVGDTGESCGGAAVETSVPGIYLESTATIFLEKSKPLSGEKQ